jgi:hypothetical protein
LVDVLAIRKHYHDIVTDPRPQTFRLLEEHNRHVLAFARLGDGGQMRIAVIGNMDFAQAQTTSTRVQTHRKTVADLLSGKRYTLTDGMVRAELAPGACLMLAFEEH